MEKADAPPDAEAVITIIVRRPEARPHLQPVRKSDVVRDIILRNFPLQSR